MKPQLPKPTSGHLDRSIFFWCPEVGLKFCNFEVSRGPFRISTLRCPEVRLGSFDFDVFVGRIGSEPREGKKIISWSPRLLGGLAGGRVRSRSRRGIPKKKSPNRRRETRL